MPGILQSHAWWLYVDVYQIEIRTQVMVMIYRPRRVKIFHSSNPEPRPRVSAERSLSNGSPMSYSEAMKRTIFNTKWWVRLIKGKMVKE
jgi:hypothetical protein